MKKNKCINLEKRMTTYKDLLKVLVIENNEPLVLVDPKKIPYKYPSFALNSTGLQNRKILVRKKVYEKILYAQKLLKKIQPEYTFLITFGYRRLEIQTERFLSQLKIKADQFYPNPLDLYEEIHRFIAVPTVAGHPTGGAIDIVIQNEKSDKIIDFGSIQYDYTTKKCYVFADNISRQAIKNRLLLRQILTRVGFAPFDGEWWHFSYGDRDWAYYYRRPNAVYSQIEIR